MGIAAADLNSRRFRLDAGQAAVAAIRHGDRSQRG
jgi:hypothetical protein